MTEQRGPICMDHSAHGIKRQKPLIIPFHQTHRIDDRRNKHPDLDQERDRIANVPILDIQSRKPQSNPNRTKESKGNQERKKQNAPAGYELVIDHESSENKQGDEKVEKSGKGC